MNALELLKNDHDAVEQLFAKVRQMKTRITPRYSRRSKEIHTHIEETIFYPKLIEAGDEELKKIVLEGIEEHRQVKMFLRELSSLAEDSEKFDPKLKVLMEDVEHHVEDEEGEMFNLVEGQIDETRLEELGASMEAEKRKFKKEYSSAASGR